MGQNKKGSNKLIIIGVLALLGIGAIAFSAKAAASEEILVTGHDSIYDYRLYNGRWFTRKKNETAWIDMLTALSAENYELAVSRLTNFLKNKA